MKNVLEKINTYYSEKILTHGPTPAGVDWNGQEGQHSRFTQLLKIIDNSDKFTISDLGCGYGELYPFLKRAGFSDFSYTGIDISTEMITEANNIYKNSKDCQFQVGDSFLDLADYCIASGIFNVRLDNNLSSWKSFIEQILYDMQKFSKKGFSCNFLTSYADKSHMKDYLYYADPLYYFDFCKRNISKNVALLHDYELYEFTLLVRK